MDKDEATDTSIHQLCVQDRHNYTDTRACAHTYGHTDRNSTDKDTDTDTDTGIATDADTDTHTHTHTYTDTYTDIDIHRHRHRHTPCYMCRER